MNEWRGLTSNSIHIVTHKDFDIDPQYILMAGRLRIAVKWGKRFVAKVFGTKPIVVFDSEECIEKAKEKIGDKSIELLKNMFNANQYKNYIFSHMCGVRWFFDKEKHEAVPEPPYMCEFGELE